MPHTHLMFFTVEDAEYCIQEPTYTREDEFVFEYTPHENPMDNIEDEAGLRQFYAQHSSR